MQNRETLNGGEYRRVNVQAAGTANRRVRANMKPAEADALLPARRRVTDINNENANYDDPWFVAENKDLTTWMVDSSRDDDFNDLPQNRKDFLTRMHHAIAKETDVSNSSSLYGFLKGAGSEAKKGFRTGNFARVLPLSFLVAGSKKLRSDENTSLAITRMIQDNMSASSSDSVNICDVEKYMEVETYRKMEAASLGNAVDMLQNSISANRRELELGFVNADFSFDVYKRIAEGDFDSHIRDRQCAMDNVEPAFVQQCKRIFSFPMPYVSTRLLHIKSLAGAVLTRYQEALRERACVRDLTAERRNRSGELRLHSLDANYNTQLMRDHGRVSVDVEQPRDLTHLPESVYQLFGVEGEERNSQMIGDILDKYYALNDVGMHRDDMDIYKAVEKASNMTKYTFSMAAKRASEVLVSETRKGESQTNAGKVLSVFRPIANIINEHTKIVCAVFTMSSIGSVIIDEYMHGGIASDTLAYYIDRFVRGMSASQITNSISVAQDVATGRQTTQSVAAAGAALRVMGSQDHSRLVELGDAFDRSLRARADIGDIGERMDGLQNAVAEQDFSRMTISPDSLSSRLGLNDAGHGDVGVSGNAGLHDSAHGGVVDGAHLDGHDHESHITHNWKIINGAICTLALLANFVEKVGNAHMQSYMAKNIDTIAKSEGFTSHMSDEFKAELGKTDISFPMNTPQLTGEMMHNLFSFLNVISAATVAFTPVSHHIHELFSYGSGRTVGLSGGIVASSNSSRMIKFIVDKEIEVNLGSYMREKKPVPDHLKKFAQSAFFLMYEDISNSSPYALNLYGAISPRDIQPDSPEFAKLSELNAVYNACLGTSLTPKQMVNEMKSQVATNIKATQGLNKGLSDFLSASSLAVQSVLFASLGGASVLPNISVTNLWRFFAYVLSVPCSNLEMKTVTNEKDGIGNLAGNFPSMRSEFLSGAAQSFFGEMVAYWVESTGGSNSTALTAAVATEMLIGIGMERQGEHAQHKRNAACLDLMAKKVMSQYLKDTARDLLQASKCGSASDAFVMSSDTMIKKAVNHFHPGYNDVGEHANEQHVGIEVEGGDLRRYGSLDSVRSDDSVYFDTQSDDAFDNRGSHTDLRTDLRTDFGAELNAGHTDHNVGHNAQYNAGHNIESYIGSDTSSDVGRDVGSDIGRDIGNNAGDRWHMKSMIGNLDKMLQISNASNGGELDGGGAHNAINASASNVHDARDIPDASSASAESLENRTDEIRALLESRRKQRRTALAANQINTVAEIHSQPSGASVGVVNHSANWSDSFDGGFHRENVARNQARNQTRSQRGSQDRNHHVEELELQRIENLSEKDGLMK